MIPIRMDGELPLVKEEDEYHGAASVYVMRQKDSTHSSLCQGRGRDTNKTILKMQNVRKGVLSLSRQEE